MHALGVAATYRPEIFDVADITQAKRIILTPEGQQSTEERWRKETPYLLDLIVGNTAINKASIVLDYGCGIGRMSKAMIERFGCRVLGVDISPSMRALAAAYVSDDRFLTCAPSALDWAIAAGRYEGHFDLAISVWVLQHCNEVEKDVVNIECALKDNGELFLVNDYNRLVPTDKGWLSDGKNLPSLLISKFDRINEGSLDPVYVGEAVASSSYWATWRR
jgi:SAM-dependent methyltransferase